MKQSKKSFDADKDINLKVYNGICVKSKKHAFKSKKTAKYNCNKRIKIENIQLVIYKCDYCKCYHLTSKISRY